MANNNGSIKSNGSNPFITTTLADDRPLSYAEATANDADSIHSTNSYQLHPYSYSTSDDSQSEKGKYSSTSGATTTFIVQRPAPSIGQSRSNPAAANRMSVASSLGSNNRRISSFLPEIPIHTDYVLDSKFPDNFESDSKKKYSVVEEEREYDDEEEDNKLSREQKSRANYDALNGKMPGQGELENDLFTDPNAIGNDRNGPGGLGRHISVRWKWTKPEEASNMKKPARAHHRVLALLYIIVSAASAVSLAISAVITRRSTQDPETPGTVKVPGDLIYSTLISSISLFTSMTLTIAYILPSFSSTIRQRLESTAIMGGRSRYYVAAAARRSTIAVAGLLLLVGSWAAVAASGGVAKENCTHLRTYNDHSSSKASDDKPFIVSLYRQTTLSSCTLNDVFLGMSVICAFGWSLVTLVLINNRATKLAGLDANGSA